MPSGTVHTNSIGHRSIPADRLAQEPQRGFAIPFGGQQEIHRDAGLPAQDRHDTRFIFHQSHPMS
jgi:hypothetical protein